MTQLLVPFLLAISVTIVTAGPRIKLLATTEDHRIVGGQETLPHEFPFIVDLTRPNHYCGGSVLSATWIMTAAHCSRNPAEEYVIVAGDHNETDWDGQEQRRALKRIVVHPNYNGGIYDNDVALYELQVPLKLNENIQPVRLPPKDFAPTGNAVVAGWGALVESGPSPDTLYKVAVPLVSNEDCNVAYNPEGYDILNSMICAGVVGKDSCQGDSGGPMMCDSEDGQVQCGIVSWGVGCAREGFPGVYSRVSTFIDWINEVTGGL